MSEYQANQKLEKILINNGFKENTSERNKEKSKKSFRFPGWARREVYFDYINIRILEKASEHDSKIKISEDELKYLLFFSQLKKTEFKEVSNDGSFRFKDCRKNIEKLKDKIDFLIRYNKEPAQKKKLEKLLKIYNETSLV